MLNSCACLIVCSLHEASLLTTVHNTLPAHQGHVQLDAAEAKAKEASEELTRTLKEKDQRTTECMKAREHLDKVRVSNERQTRELEAAG